MNVNDAKSNSGIQKGDIYTWWNELGYESENKKSKKN